MTHNLSLSRRLILALTVTAAVAACDTNSSTPPSSSPTRGHDLVSASDSSGETVPGGTATATPAPPVTDTSHAALPVGPGKIHGQVRGQIPVTPGLDSVASAPKLAGVDIGIYPCLKEFCAGDAVGPVAATMTTDANGQFASPTLPGGYYTVVFTPPAQSGYRGVYSWYYMNPSSDDYAWWVMLSKK